MTKTDEPVTPVKDPAPVERVLVPVDKGPVARQYFKEDAPWVVSFRVPVHLEAMIRSESTASGVSLNTVMVKTMEAGFHPSIEVDAQPHLRPLPTPFSRCSTLTINRSSWGTSKRTNGRWLSTCCPPLSASMNTGKPRS